MGDETCPDNAYNEDSHFSFRSIYSTPVAPHNQWAGIYELASLLEFCVIPLPNELQEVHLHKSWVSFVIWPWFDNP